MSDENKLIEIPSEYFPEELLDALNETNNLPEDFTFYLTKKQGKSLLEQLQIDSSKKIEPVRLSVALCGEKKVEGRALICLSYGELIYSVTFRLLEGERTVKELKGKKFDSGEEDTGFTPNKKRFINSLNSISEICEIIKDALFHWSKEDYTNGELQGLILITGATASAKSQITRGLIDNYLRSTVQVNKRRSHLVTFEDPIEKYFIDLDEKTLINSNDLNIPLNIPAHDHNIDYTPREKGKGVDTVKEAFEDALRQTPKVFFVGETRDDPDWIHLMRFAGSGHLVVTTAHAGSLIESMQLIFKANNVKNASERNHIANRILAIVHIKRLKIGELSVLLPSIWLKTSISINNITATGLTSLTPGIDSKRGGALGRKYFADELIKIAKKNIKESIEEIESKKAGETDTTRLSTYETELNKLRQERELIEKNETDILKTALVLDLKGE